MWACGGGTVVGNIVHCRLQPCVFRMPTPHHLKWPDTLNIVYSKLKTTDNFVQQSSHQHLSNHRRPACRHTHTWKPLIMLSVVCTSTMMGRATAIYVRASWVWRFAFNVYGMSLGIACKIAILYIPGAHPAGKDGEGACNFRIPDGEMQTWRQYAKSSITHNIILSLGCIRALKPRDLM